MIMGQGYLANRCLFGWLDADDCRTTAALALGAIPTPPYTA
jgi:hypothetical protein